MLKLLQNFGFGILFGGAQLVPGVSGGSIAIVFGFYERLLAAINHFRKEPKKHLAFIAPFMLGIAAAMLFFSSFIVFLLDEFPFPTMLFFIGLIAGSLPMINGHIKANSADDNKIDWKAVAALAIPLGLIISLAHIGGDAYADTTEVVIDLPYMVFIFAMGIVAAGALIIPGLSGSFMLLLVGLYPLAIAAVADIRLWLVNPGNTELLLGIMSVLAPLGLGVIVGVLAVSRLVEKLFERYTKLTYCAAYGLMIGSIYALIVDDMVLGSDAPMPVLFMGLGAAVAGCVLSYFFGAKQK